MILPLFHLATVTLFDLQLDGILHTSPSHCKIFLQDMLIPDGIGSDDAKQLVNIGGPLE